MLLQPAFLRLYQRIYGDEIEEEEEEHCTFCWNLVSKTITMDCGHCACLPCLRKKTFQAFCCPTCWEFSQLRTLQDDIAMHPDGEGMCELHREDQKFYCPSDKTLLCVTCSKSEDHEDHIHWPIAVAAVPYRKMIQTDIKSLSFQIKEIQGLQFHANRPLAWAVVSADHKDIVRQRFVQEMQVMWEYLKKKKENPERAEVEELIMGTGNKELLSVYQRLKEMEAAQQQDIMKQRKEWEALMFQKSTFLRDKIRELEEKSQKSNVELLQDMSHTFERNYLGMNFKAFIPQMNTFYLNVAMEFLKLLQTPGLPQTCNSYNFSEEKRSSITFVPESSGKTYPVYTTGNLQADSVRAAVFLLATSSTTPTLWTAIFDG